MPWPHHALQYKKVLVSLTHSKSIPVSKFHRSCRPFVSMTRLCAALSPLSLYLCTFHLFRLRHAFRRFDLWSPSPLACYALRSYHTVRIESVNLQKTQTHDSLNLPQSPRRCFVPTWALVPLMHMVPCRGQCGMRSNSLPGLLLVAQAHESAKDCSFEFCQRGQSLS